MTRMRLLDLFSGIGGFSLGLERSGAFETVAFCEIDPFCRKALAKHWPKVPCYDDVKTLTAERLATDGIGPIDAICGGFPCQDISLAGGGKGIEGERSGLWSEYARIIGEIQPQFVIVENVAALLGRGLSRVLGDLAALGYDAEWNCIPASYVGAPHRRDRIWIVAYASSIRRDTGRSEQSLQGLRKPSEASMAYAGCEFRQSVGIQREEPASGWTSNRPGDGSSLVANTASGRQPTDWRSSRQAGHVDSGGENMADSDCEPPRRLAISWREFDQWFIEPDVGRVANGVPARVDRLRSLGNAVVPQIPELIGRAIMESLEIAAPTA